MTHKGSMTKLSGGAIATANALVTFGADDKHIVVVSAVTDVPVGTVPTTTAAAEDEIAVLLLGSANDTREMVAGEDLSAGDPVFSGADGRVTALPAAAGTYFCVGTALADAVEDDDVEIDPCTPTPVVVA